MFLENRLDCKGFYRVILGGARAVRAYVIDILVRHLCVGNRGIDRLHRSAGLFVHVGYPEGVAG